MRGLPGQTARHRAGGRKRLQENCRGRDAYKHTIVASSPIDINLAKQLNILLDNLGVADDMILMDPTVSGIGYGLEYCYSVMERMRMAV